MNNSTQDPKQKKSTEHKTGTSTNTPSGGTMPESERYGGEWKNEAWKYVFLLVVAVLMIVAVYTVAVVLSSDEAGKTDTTMTTTEDLGDTSDLERELERSDLSGVENELNAIEQEFENNSGSE